MSKFSLMILATAACILMQTASAQGNTRRMRSTASKTLHKAWLAEKLDLNTKAAAGIYDETIKKSTPNMPERWIAFVRLEELARLGVLEPEPKTRPSQMPLAVRKALKELDTPIPYRTVLENPLLETPLPALRPATPLVQEWARKQVEPTLAERLAQSRRAWLRQRTSPTDRLRRRQAHDVLQCELQGKRTQAEQLRILTFPNYKPPAVTGTPEATLAEAKQRLAEWINTEQVSWRRPILRELQKGIETEAKRGPRNAVRFLQRLPFYAEKLLGPKKPEPAAKPGDKK